MMRSTIAGLAATLLPVLVLPAPCQSTRPLAPMSEISIDLSGKWDFCTEPGVSPSKASSETSVPQGIRPSLVTVPGPWENSGQVLPNPGWNLWEPYNGVAWCWREVAVPREWSGFDAELFFGDIGDRGRVYWNGTSLGEISESEPDAKLHVPAGSLMAGTTSTLLVRVVNDAGPGGILGPSVGLRVLSPYDKVSIAVGFPHPSETERADATRSGLPDIYAHTGSSVTVKVTNGADFPVSGVLTMDVHSEMPHPAIAFRHTVSATIPGTTSTVDFRLPELTRGWYEARAALALDSGPVLFGQHSFTVLEPFAATQGGPATSPFGVDSGIFSITGTPAPATQISSRPMRERGLGAAWARITFLGENLDPSVRMWDWTSADRMVRAHRDQGIEMVATLRLFSSQTANSPTRDEQGIREYVGFVEQVARRYRGQVQYWEVWDEPNSPVTWQDPDPKQYARLLVETYRTLKLVDPDNRVIGFATGGTDLDFISRSMEAGAHHSFDVASVHPFQTRPPWESENPVDGRPAPYTKLRALRHALDKHGRQDAEIWVTAFGYETMGATSLADQAALLVQSTVWLLADGIAKRLFWFTLDDRKADGADMRRHCGLCFSDGSPKPSYLACRTLVEKISGFRSVHRVDCAAGADRFSFDIGSAGVDLIWARNTNVEIPVRPNQEAVDLFGRRIPLSSGLLSVGKMPVFLLYSAQQGDRTPRGSVSVPRVTP